MVIFNACKIENNIVYYFKRPVGIIKNSIAVVPERFYSRELESFLEESGYDVLWVSYLPEELKRAV